MLNRTLAKTFLLPPLSAALFACAAALPPQKALQNQSPPPPAAALYFQFNQQVKLQLLDEDPALLGAFTKWVNSGVYSQTPVYRQLPGIFIIAGKPRLKGEPFVRGTLATPLPKNKKPKEASKGYAGLVIHADGTVGPELVLTYGRCFRAYCEGPANIRIAKITDNSGALGTVQRGDNLISIAIEPR